MKADGCFASVLTSEINGTEVTLWVRDCCFANDHTCLEFHDDIDEDGFTGHVDQSW